MMNYFIRNMIGKSMKAMIYTHQPYTNHTTGLKDDEIVEPLVLHFGLSP